MKRILLLLAVLITISAPIFASDWRYLTTSADGDQLYIDMDSISRYESYTDVWIKYISPSIIIQMVHYMILIQILIRMSFIQ